MCESVKVLSVGKMTGHRRRGWNIYESIFIIFLVFLTGFILLRSPLFEVRNIKVHGNQLLEEGKIISLSEIATGSNIFKIDLAEAKDKLKLIPLVKEARVTRSLPATVVIVIEERIPVGILPTGEGFIEVDGEGIYLRKASVGTPGLPLVTGVEFSLPSPGDVIVADGLKEALAIINELDADTVAVLSEVNIGYDGQIKLYTMQGVQCRFGLAENIREKGEIFTGLLAELRSALDRVNYIDLSSVDKPVVYYKVD
jgi:cell division protein FtsQ